MVPGTPRSGPGPLPGSKIEPLSLPFRAVPIFSVRGALREISGKLREDSGGDLGAIWGPPGDPKRNQNQGKITKNE